MSAASELIALAKRCEAATGANYALEVAIFKAIHPEYAGYVEGRGGLVHPNDGSDVRVLSDVRPGNYTASLDAAQAMAAATPVPPPSPATYESETHKDRTAREDGR